MKKARKAYKLKGQVQGVGFRPFIYKLALENTLTGFIYNNSQGVYLELQGFIAALESFEKNLYLQLPPLAKITNCEILNLSLVQDELNFSIQPSQKAQDADETEVSIPPDIALCSDCEKDMQSGRRKNYAFTNCTNCGPRYSIIKQIPYDRKFTSMACFPLCKDCEAEYNNPLDRRFHAQPNACPKCGPKTWLIKLETKIKQAKNTLEILENNHDLLLKTHYAESEFKDFEAIDETARLLSLGYIIAMKGLGGFHLVCDASNPKAIKRLRQRKQRPDKAFALMLKDINEAQKITILKPEDKALLNSPEHPIVLCQKQDIQTTIPAELIAPDSEQFGIMLPYTPMQKILLESFSKYQQQNNTLSLNKNELVAALIMTSGNNAGMPLCIGNREAIANLADFADAFLLHDRDILLRIDDSVVSAQQSFYQLQDNETDPCPTSLPNFIFLRRARGYVPKFIELSQMNKPKQVLGIGAELKSTLCFAKQNKALISQHIGDLENLETLNFQQELINHLSKLLNFKADCIVHDLHPNFLSTKLALELAETWAVPAFSLQHHYAHARSLSAEYQLEEPFLCLSLDGTGYGDDGTIWGGELLLLDPCSSEQKRLGSLELLPILGGDLAIKEPWRLAYGALKHYDLLSSAGSWIKTLNEDQQAQLPLLDRMLKQKLNLSWTSSLGRLFDSVAALNSLSSVISYEGQAAQRLEQALYQKNSNNIQALNTSSIKPQLKTCIQNFDNFKHYELPITTTNERELEYRIQLKPLFIQLVKDIEMKRNINEISLTFHLAIINAFVNLTEEMSKKHKLKKIGLTGGCFANQFLLNNFIKICKNRDLDVFWSDKLPLGDGAISLGQVAFGRILN